MANLNGFNANEVEPNEHFDAIPAGKYVAAITDSKIKPTKRGDGSYLELELTLLEGEYKGRKLWDRLCINHPNVQTVQIARGKLSAICRAVGVMQPQDSLELHNLPLTIRVTCKRREDTGEIVNEVKGYEKKESAVQDTSTPTGIPKQVTNITPPWQR